MTALLGLLAASDSGAASARRSRRGHGRGGTASSVGSGLIALHQNITYKNGKKYTKVCGTTLTLDGVLHNNFGGEGPDAGAEGITWYGREILSDGAVKRNVHVEAHAVSKYTPWKDSENNGLHREFGHIVMPSGHSVKLRFDFKDAFSGQRLKLPQLTWSVYDMDQHRDNAREFVRVFGPHTTETAGKDDRMLEKMDVNGGTEYMSSEAGTGRDNPKLAEFLTREQRDRSISFHFTDVDRITAEIGSTEGPAFRAFTFSFMSAMRCRLVEMTDPDPYPFVVGGALLAFVVLGGELGYIAYKSSPRLPDIKLPGVSREGN